MGFTRGHWRPKLAVLGCIVYGVTVAAITFAPALAALWRITRPDTGHGSASVSADNTLMMHITMSSTRIPTWSSTVNLGTLFLWMLGPPLLVWIAWLASGPKPPDAAVELDDSMTSVNALNEPVPDLPYVRADAVPNRERSPHE